MAMYRSNRLELPEELGYQMAESSPISAFKLDNSTNSTTDTDYPNLSQPEEFAQPLIILPPGHTLSQQENAQPIPLRSNGLEFALSVSSTGLNSGFIGHRRDINEAFDISINSHSMPPPGNQPGASTPFLQGLEIYGMMSSSTTIDDAIPGFYSQGCLAANQAMQTEPRYSNDTNFTGILNEDLQLPSSESFYFGEAVHFIGQPSDDLARQVDAHSGTLNLQWDLQTPPPPLAFDSQGCDIDPAWSIRSSPSSIMDEVSQMNHKSDPLCNGIIGFLPRVLQSHKSSGKTLVKPDSAPTTNRVLRVFDSGLEVSSQPNRTNMNLKYCKIAPKHETSPASVHSRRRSMKKGGRTGPLTPKGSEKATMMRAIRSCTYCFINHVGCSEGLVCDKCQKRDASSGIKRISCLRGPLQSFAYLLSPPFLSGHTTPWFLDNWMKQYNVLFTSNHIDVRLSSVPFDISMSLVVHEILVKDPNSLLVSDLLAQTGDDTHGFAARSTLPYGYNNDADQLRRRCSDYINKVSRYLLDTTKITIGDTSQIVWDAIDAVSRFDLANPKSRKASISLEREFVKLASALMRDGLIDGGSQFRCELAMRLKEGVLRKGINVFWMDYMMNRSFVFTDDSAEKAIHGLQNSPQGLVGKSFADAALLNRQIKVAISLLFEKGVEHLFEEAEKKLRTNRASFAISFCLNIILCVLVEQIQTAIHGVIIDKVSNGQDAGETRRMGIALWEELEELPMRYAWTLFEGIQRKYNPFKHGCHVDNGSGQNQGEAELVDRFRELMYKHDEAISEKIADSTCLAGASDTAADHQSLRPSNSGRHVARFLREFS